MDNIGIQWEDVDIVAMERLVAHCANMWPDLIMVKSLQSKKLLSLNIKAYHLS